MKKCTKMLDEENTLPHMLLIALFLKGLAEDFADTKRAMEDDISQGKKMKLSMAHRRCTSKCMSLQRTANEANLAKIAKANLAKLAQKSPPPPKKPPVQSKMLCRNFQKFGSCRCGDTCKFVHQSAEGVRGEPGTRVRGRWEAPTSAHRPWAW